MTGLAQLMQSPLSLLLVGWALAWKGIALWKAARRDRLGWFVVLLIINAAGLLEIIYIFLVAREPDLISGAEPSL